MSKFDHRFDSAIQRKEDVRFMSLEEAEDYATSQCRMYGSAQNVLSEDGLLKVVEFPRPLPENLFFVDEVFE